MDCMHGGVVDSPISPSACTEMGQSKLLLIQLVILIYMCSSFNGAAEHLPPNMEAAIEPENVAVQEQYCFHCHGKTQQPAEGQAAPDAHYLDGSVPNMQIVRHGDGGQRTSSQKMQQTGSNIMQAMKSLRRRHGFSGKPEKRKASSAMKTHWTAEETEALLLAIESCNLLDPGWSLRANKWDKVLKHMHAHGFCEKTIYTVQKKFQNIHWAFRNLKAWRVRKKLPLFENLSTKDRLDRLLPGNFCPELYARMEAFFASSGLDDGVHLVKDQNHIRRRKLVRPVCHKNNVMCDDDDDDDDEEEEDDDDDGSSYRPGGASSSVIRKCTSRQLAPRLCTTIPNKSKSKGKPGNVQPRKQHFRPGGLRGLLLTGDMDLEKVLKEENVYNEDVCDAECCTSEKDDDILHVGGAKEVVGYLEGFESPTNFTNVDDKDCNKLMDGNTSDNNEGINARDGRDDGELKQGEMCADDQEISIHTKGCTKKQLKRLIRSAAALDNAVSSQRAQKTRKVQSAEEVEGQSASKDGKANYHVILQQVATNNKQLSDCIRAVILSIQTVSLMMDKFQE
ncbi:hypothetical protein GOP47_0005844 [Adiantum capillus-veneris]|uniref:Myb/SANT-like DNA-binding domain-containing protein n=1 Tax=Adiantum capillus-veneris TaxID=13818 RepID=A0A9D4ZPH8_ADICA|nr:hypothetical protein GOP47_0005844 [Adiantum capillus-veneris]